MKFDTKTLKYSLQAIDRFTMQFEDEKQLKEHLVLFGILPPELIDKPLVIRFVSQRKNIRNYAMLLT